MKRLIKTSTFLVAVVLAVQAWIPDSAKAFPWLSNPSPSITTGNDFVTVKLDLFGFGNYGESDWAADVLYNDRESGSWQVDFTSWGIDVSKYNLLTFSASLALDDHYDIPTSIYALDISAGSDTMFSGQTDSLGLSHGAPYGTRFTNWKTFSATLSVSQDPFLISMTNNTENIYNRGWIAIDSIELRLSSTSETGVGAPEPASMLLLGIGIIGLAGLRKKFYNRII